MKKYLTYTTEEILEAVKQNGYNLQFVEKYYKSIADIVEDEDYKALCEYDTIELNGKKYKLIK